MKDILTFMGEHPFQTFLLVFLVGLIIGECAKYTAIAIRGWPPPGRDDDDDED